MCQYGVSLFDVVDAVNNPLKVGPWSDELAAMMNCVSQFHPFNTGPLAPWAARALESNLGCLKLFLFLNTPVLLIDIFSCVLGVRRAIQGRGSSGIPLVTLLYYVYVPIFWVPISPFAKLMWILAGFMVHLLLFAGIPTLVRILHDKWAGGSHADH
jgi:hypothetical protein